MAMLDIVLSVTITLMMCLHKQSQAEFNDMSPCPRLFVYEGKSPDQDRWYGIVTLLSDTDLSGVWLRLIFDRPSLQLGNWFGQVVTTDNKEYLIKNRNAKLKAHTPQTVRFYVKYDNSEPAPRLMSFRLNARTVCPEDIATEANPSVELQTSGPSTNDSGGGSNTATTVKPEASNGGGGGNGGFNLGPPASSGEEEEFFPGDFSFFNRPHLNPIDDQNLNQICGTVVTSEREKRQLNQYQYSYPYNNNNNNNYQNQNYYQNRYSNQNNYHQGLNRDNSYVRQLAQPRPLITFGQSTQEGEFPWHAALYHAKGIDLAYICGASLISKLHVISVAHCVTRRKSKVPLNPDNLVVYLGKYYLKRFSSPGIQDRQVSEIFPHPQYNAQTYSNDIALVKFTAPAEITDYVRPVCLWQESADLNTVLNKQGNVVGWGFDETGKVTEELMQAKMPVVSQETCIFSFPEFYSRFISNNTFCAGFRNGTSVCNGDSGGGMVFAKPNSNPKHPRWQLRGLVSISVALQNQFKCDTSHYVVFTDTAKYLNWIMETMRK